MIGIVELDIHGSQDSIATLFADPENNPKWMDDVKRYEPLSGEQGMPGSTYRLVPKKGSMVFVATVVSRDLPNEIRLSLDASNVVVSVTARFISLSAEKTRLVSKEEFRFKGLVSKLVGFFARGSISKAHRRHMEAFKQFAEQRG
jgi:hypothetical protein